MKENFFPFEFESGKTAACRYAEFGDDGNPPMLFIHGYGAMWQHWERNIAAFEGDHKIYALDLLGFGESEKPNARYGLSLWAQQIAAFSRFKNLRQMILVGHSMGAASSLWFANDHPESLLSLVLVDSSGIFPDEVGTFERLLYRAVGSPIIGEALFVLFANEFGARQSLSPTYLDQSHVTDELVAQFAKPLRSPGAIYAYLAPSRNPERFLLDQFPRPCRYGGNALIVWGAEDLAFPPAKVLPKFKEILPQAQTVVLPNARHCPHHEIAESFNAVLKEFLAETARC
ncbi:MAG: alpha/beta fold hydrolase [Chloroherpetonaceae bacterium]|nr:alpha/beta fold hydrolase [Chloroherpetonaceae bacterium]MDW8436684.1 alpha/beta fold hydrolase [Chloroherpetonaceae bacterium]